MNILSPADGELFYEIWIPVLDYANTTKKVHPELPKIVRNMSVGLDKLYSIAEKVWEDSEFIDRYLEAHPSLPEEHRQILTGWKRRVHGSFMVERHRRDDTIFIGGEEEHNEKVYSVIGIMSSLYELFPSFVLPMFIHATLVPWKGKIIPDGLINAERIKFGPGIVSTYKERFLKAKREGKIITSL